MRLIDADTLKENFPSEAKVTIGQYTFIDHSVGIMFVRETIDDAPTIDAVEVVHGEWNQTEIIDDDSETGVNDDASQCSVCGYVFDSHYWAKTYFNYCPNCGAKMDGEEQK